MKRLAIIVALLVASASTSAAQTVASDGTAERREKIKQRIRALRAYTLTEQLKLDEATAAKLFPALAKYDDEFDKLLKARAELQRRLRDASASSSNDSKVVDALIDEALANQRAIWDAEARRLDQLRKILTPAQVARLLVVLPAMERKVQSQLRKVIEEHRATRGDIDKRDQAGKRSDGTPEDPSSDERPLKKPAAPKGPGGAARKQGPCDPFTNPHGCK